jgi:hypothetical protein
MSEIDKTLMDTPIIEYCNKCKQYTLHDVKAHTLDINDFEEKEEAYYIEWGRKLYQILECRVCKDTFARTRERVLVPCTHPLEEGTQNHYLYSENYHPKRLVNTLPIKEFGVMPSMLLRAYQEIVFCYNNDKLITCSSAIKMFMEGIGTFSLQTKKNVQGMKSLRSICMDVLNMPLLDALKYSSKFDFFLTFRDIHAPEKAELRIIIELLEDLLIKLFPKKTKQGSF